MDVLWSPWRYEYIKANESSGSQKSDSCIFCDLQSLENGSDEEKYILFRARFNFVILNIYPYISGHLLIIPFAHSSDLDSVAKEATDEMMDLAKLCQTVLRTVYRPDGFNLGMNLGKAAGAGVAEHVHLHVMPRWFGDSNFMTTIAETRVIPEDLQTTYRKLVPKFNR